MIFHDTSLVDAKLIDLEPRGDERGFFARTMCLDEFAGHGIAPEFVQQNMSVSAQAGTLRGLHFQRAPHSEDKLIRCVRGAIFDVIVDLRPGSPSFMRHEAFELCDANRRMLWIPQGFAHGFLTLTDACEVTYLVTRRYEAAAEGGLRHDDPRLAIDWPRPASVLSDKDADWPLLDTDRPAFF
ncbi:dTDP-4-dehydrorhamnose 3,5-epimerase [Marinivivus vitaminiproducens]|uniref:dTDP-4-dehydrorhamnose 3,5-epimerase n=1 Tax=Marinivivus vitaminiproducens TaxID=3035935 RepID=UPI00279BFC99|nr:dTDP-4-dehydrorhamnose 3,5-epimerase [Geminicoccaceae bacterium SCSIO 64248]WGF89264.1 dTDP-4-dehydrorhamnose 3,5-epimerase [Geminicoccaceae bacterium SCSIO 64248]